MVMTIRLLGPASEKEIYRSKKLIVLWDEIVGEWGIYRKNDRVKVLQWIGSDEDLLTWCEQTSNLKLPEELQPLADQRKAERKARYEDEERERKREEAQEAERKAREAERREKYLESLSEEDEEDVLARERKRERKREQKEEEYQEWRKAGKPGGPTLLTMIEEPEEPGGGTLLTMIKEPEEVEEVFPWEKEGISQD